LIRKNKLFAFLTTKAFIEKIIFSGLLFFNVMKQQLRYFTFSFKELCLNWSKHDRPISFQENEKRGNELAM